MRTVIAVGIGRALLFACAAAKRLLVGPGGLQPAMLTIPLLGLVGADVSVRIGAKHAGYSVADEAPTFVVVFTAPTAVAALLEWKPR